jgi:alkylation response protein AidB-like acyl-CoA dehydrogenase
MLSNSILKVAVSEDVQKTVDGIQIWGMGFSEDTDGKCLRDARIVRIYEGAQRLTECFSSRQAN